MVDYFRIRAIAAGIATLVMGAIALGVLAVDTPAIFRGMVSGAGLPFALLAIVSALAVLFQLWRRVYVFHRVLTVVAVGSFVFAWGVGQAPYLLPGRLTIEQAAGAYSTQVFLVVVTVVALALVIPSLGLLYLLDQRNDLEPPEASTEGG
jgi:cytochrome d ubiquinol oxidase subunit II